MTHQLQGARSYLVSANAVFHQDRQVSGLCLQSFTRLIFREAGCEVAVPDHALPRNTTQIGFEAR